VVIQKVLKIVQKKSKKRRKVTRQWHFESFLFIHINKAGGSSIEKGLDIPLEHRIAKENRRARKIFLGPEIHHFSDKKSLGKNTIPFSLSTGT